MTHSGFGCGFQCPACDGAENPRFPKVFPRFPHPAKLFQTFSLTLSTPHPSLSLPMKSALQKLASFLVCALLYAIAGYAFFFVFFRSQF
jgi:hypothetical protein